MKKLLVILVMLVAINANAQWEPDVRLTNATGDSYTTGNNTWCIAANGNVVHIVWMDRRDSNWEIYYKRSYNSGVTWEADIRLTNSPANSENPSIALSDSLVHVVWMDRRDGNYEIYYKRSTDGGANWGSDTRLTNNAPFFSGSPSLSVSGSNVHVVWTDNRDGNYEVYYKRSTDNGIYWGADTRLTNNNENSSIQSIAVYGSFVNVVWHFWHNNNWQIYYKCSTDAGISWSEDTRLTYSASYSWYPSLAVSGTFVHAVWEDLRDGNEEIYYKRSTDGGINWEADTRLTNNTAWSRSPVIIVSDSNVHVVWSDTRDGIVDVFYKRSTDGGITWEGDTRLTNNTTNSWYPSIVVSGSIVHVVWTDNREGDYEIYYKRNPTGNLVDIQNISTEIPSAFSLSQNYPNPFNPVTKINFDVPSTLLSPRGLSGLPATAGNLIQLKVYDITGREIQTLVNESLNPGTYEVTFDGSSLNTGVYFYKMSAGNYSETKKMLLIK